MSDHLGHIKIFVFAAIGAALAATLGSCAERKSDVSSGDRQKTVEWDIKSPRFEYAMIKAELKLAELQKTYLVVDFSKKEIVLKLKGAVVWNVPLRIVSEESDSEDDFVERFIDNNNLLVRPILDKHLFSGRAQSPDTVLKIVSEVVRADVALMQREIPERFLLEWGDGLLMEFRTEIAGQPKSKFKNTLVELRRTLQRPFGEACLVAELDSRHALTLYRVADQGLPTLIYPPNK
jgi:hypothetical protein